MGTLNVQGVVDSCGVKGELWEHYIPNMHCIYAHSPWMKNLAHERGTRFLVVLFFLLKLQQLK